MINIVILTDILKSFQGGTEKQILNLIQKLNKNLFNIKLICLDNVPLHVNIINNEYPGFEYLGVRRIYSLHGIIKGFHFMKFLKKQNTDILMTYHFGSDIWGTIFGKLAGIPLIISNRRDEGFWRKKVHILAYRLINKLVDWIVAVSKAVEKVIVEEEGVSKDKIEVIHNGVDIERYIIDKDISYEKKELGIPYDAKVVGCVGNLKPIKGHKFLIDAAQYVSKVFPKICFLLIGWDDLHKSLQSKVKDINLDKNIIFLGIRKDIPELLKIMDICVLPSLSEGLSNTLLEYMAAEKPIIATNVGGNKELITHQENGILVPPKDSQALAESIINLLNNPELREKLADAAKIKVTELFSIGKMVDKYEKLFEKLTKKYKPRICHLISSNGLFGAENVMLNLVSNMNYDGVDSSVAAIRNTHNPHNEVIEEAKKENIPSYVIESIGRFDPKSVLRLARFLKNENIDLLHTHNYKSNIIGLLAARLAGIPVISTVHGYTNGSKILNLYEKLDRFVLKIFFNKIVAVDSSVAEHFKYRSTVIYNGIDITKFSKITNKDLRKEFNILKDDVIIGTVGRLSKEKNQELLIKAAQELIKKYSNLKFMIVGDGPLKNSLWSMVDNPLLKNKVIFTGIQTDMVSVYKTMDIFALTSLTEGIPIVILEAFASGVPVISSKVGGVSNLVIDGKTGLLFDSGDVKGLIKAISSLIDDKKKREVLAENARQFVKENYSLEKMVNAYRGVYEEVLSSYCVARRA